MPRKSCRVLSWRDIEELRTKTIADVVTGQIDVRDVVIPEYSRDEDTDADDIEDDEEESED